MDESPIIKLTPAIEDHAALLALNSQRAYEKASELYEKESWGPRGYKSAKDHLYYIEKLDTFSILYDEVIVGGLIISDNGFDVKEIVRVFVDPDFWGNGIGSAALKIAMDNINAKAWTCGTIDWNQMNQNFLEKNGFKRIGQIKGDESMIWYQNKVEELELPSIEELSTDMNRIVVEGTIVEKAVPRQVRSKRRWQTLTVTEATLKDNTDDIVLVLWNEQIKQCVVDDRVRIEGGYMKKYRGLRQLNVGKVGKLITLD